MNEVTLPKNAVIAAKMLEAQHTSKKLELGVMGKIFGGGSEKNGNIAGFVLIICFIVLVLIGVMVPTLIETHAQNIAASIFSLITLTIGYIFGRKGSE